MKSHRGTPAVEQDRRPSRLDGVETNRLFPEPTDLAPERSVRRRAFRSRADLLAIVPVALVTFAVVAAAFTPASGPFALALVLEPHLFIAALIVLSPVAILGRARTLALGLVVTLVGGGFLFGSEWVSLPGSGASRHDISVMTWNVQYGTRTPAEQAAQLEGVTADLIALQEVEPDASNAIENDPVLTARYPYRAMAPRAGAFGLAILSRYPISGIETATDPAILELIVAMPRGKVRVIETHPRPPAMDTVTPLRLPVGYNPARRDAAIAAVRIRVDAALAAGDRLLVLGDYNTSPREAEYAVLTAGLRDTQVEVGEGPGWTWRPSRLTFLPVGFLRIDMQLTAGSILPASTSIDCSLPGDHCRLSDDYEID
jgi:vancomycin resistance protein VanJ